MKNQSSCFVVRSKEYALNENNYMTISIVRIDDRLHELKTVVRFLYDYTGKFLGRNVRIFMDGELENEYTCAN